MFLSTFICLFFQVTVRVFLQPTEQDQDQYLGEYMFLMAANSSNPETFADHQVNKTKS